VQEDNANNRVSSNKTRRNKKKEEKNFLNIHKHYGTFYCQSFGSDCLLLPNRSTGTCGRLSTRLTACVCMHVCLYV
jgi:hypothetical protein